MGMATPGIRSGNESRGGNLRAENKLREWDFPTIFAMIASRAALERCGSPVPWWQSLALKGWFFWRRGQHRCVLITDIWYAKGSVAVCVVVDRILSP